MKRDMRKYILRKLVELIFTLLFVTLLSFLLMRLSSVDPATAYAKRMIGNPTAEQIEKIRIQLGFDTRTDMEMGKAYVMCAIASGASKLRIMLIHIFPNLIAEMIRFLCLSCADMILAITGFSFIGLGLGDNVVDWGSMILDARGALVLHPTMILYPIGAVILSTLCFNVIGRQLTTKEAE